MTRMTSGTGEYNLERYSSPEVVAHFAGEERLTRCEEALFERYLRPDSAILDLGVGGGRTTPYLTARASSYVGVDISAAMIAACKAKFPAHRFEVADATDLAAFRDATFDAVVFSFNGIDNIDTDEGRLLCLREIARVLADGGVFIFSSHNARQLAIVPQLFDARGLQIPWRIARSAWTSIEVFARNMRAGVVRSGEGYVIDRSHGGLWTYVSTPPVIAAQLHWAGLEPVERLSGLWPYVNHRLLAPWYYYVAGCTRRSSV
jgi:SAM-dependent methyltransferase